MCVHTANVMFDKSQLLLLVLHLGAYIWHAVFSCMHSYTMLKPTECAYQWVKVYHFQILSIATC